jgi:c-di-GMP-related signal transduction protein
MIRVVEAISVDHETKAVLLGAASKLRPLYDLMIARESGDWDTIKTCSSQLSLSEKDVAQAYWQAMQWARQINCA